MTISRNIFYLIVCIFLISACNKEPIIKQLSFPQLEASIDGVKTTFMSPVTARSISNANGGFDLEITGINEITTDSSTKIRFIIPDFTRTGSQKMSYNLNTNFNGNFIEWRSTVSSTQGKYHYFQQGSLTVEQDANKYLKGSFDFVYFIFDNQGNKIKQITVSDGKFSDIIIE